MKPSEYSFSFEKVFDKPVSSDETLVKINPSEVDCLLKHGLELKKLIESEMEQAKRKNVSQILSESSFSEFKFSQEELFKKFLGLMDNVNKRYIDSITLFRDTNLKCTNNKELYDFVKENFDDSMAFNLNLTNYEFPDGIPKLSNAFEPVFHAFAKYYNTDKAFKVFEVITQKNKTFVDACRGELLGVNYPIDANDFISVAKNIFKHDSKDIIINKKYIDSFFIDFEDSCRQSIYNDFAVVKQDYKKLYAFINKNRETLLELDNASSSYATERIFMNTILEICTAHLMAFQIKLDCLSEVIAQNYEILWKAAELCKTSAKASKSVNEAVEFAMARSITDKPTDEYDELTKDGYDDLEFEQLLTDCCIREALIISEGVNVEERLESLHEGVIDSIKDILVKIKNFIVQAFNRFSNWFDKYTASTKTYLEKYKDLITKNKLAGFEPVDIKDYETGMKRIKTQIDLSQLQSKVQQLAAGGKENEETSELQICQAIIKEYTGKDKNNNDQSFADFCKDYFLGGSETQKKSAEQFAPDEMYNTCYNTQDLVNMIKADQEKVTKFVDMLTEETQKAANQIDKNNQDAAAKKSEDTQNKKESTYMPGTFFIEAIEVQTVKSTTTAANNNPNVQSTVKGADTKDFNSTKTQIQGLPEDNANTSEGLESRIKLYRTMAKNIQTVLSAKSIAAETICSDYMKLIKISVSFYLAQAKK